VIEGKYYDYKSDVFSFGVVMYEIFARILPYTNISSLLHVSTTHVGLDKIDTEEKVEALRNLGYEVRREEIVVWLFGLVWFGLVFFFFFFFFFFFLLRLQA
jgi:serine/threonine protein kinase